MIINRIFKLNWNHRKNFKMDTRLKYRYFRFNLYQYHTWKYY